MSDAELKELVASLAIAQRETDRQLRETDRQLKETDRQLKETDLQVKETSRVVRENSIKFEEYQRNEARANAELREGINEMKKQIGGLGNKFGDFAEGMAIPSLIDILAKRFGAEQIIETRRMRKGSDEIELDLIGATNGDKKTVVVAEVKSVLNQRELDKFVRNLKRFFTFFPQFRGYKLFGIIGAVESSQEIDAATFSQGIALARMHGDIFRVKQPRAFLPRDFSK